MWVWGSFILSEIKWKMKNVSIKKFFIIDYENGNRFKCEKKSFEIVYEKISARGDVVVRLVAARWHES